MAYPYSDGNVLYAADMNSLTLETYSAFKNLLLKGSGADGAYNPGSDETITGVKHYTSFNIATGRVITVGNGSTNAVNVINISGDATISGTLQSGSVNNGGAGGSNGNVGYCLEGTPAQGGIYSGAGGAGYTYTNGSTEYLLMENSYFTGGGGSGSSSGNGGAGGGGYASGGNAISGTAPVGTLTGGSGVSAIFMNIFGNLTVTGTISANGSQGNSGSQSGAGGGGGSLLFIRVRGTCNLSGSIITANGGNGGNSSYSAGRGGGGGGGGAIILVSGNTYTAPTTLTANGGAGGTAPGGNGNPGSNGLVRIIS